MRLDYRDTRPIYLQIKDDIRSRIVCGALRAGDRMPSVRELASELSINPNTIQRAYRELEAEGVIISVQGKGSFIASDNCAVEDRRAELLVTLRATVADMLSVGYSAKEIEDIIKEVQAK